jgi:hypothetical protein
MVNTGRWPIQKNAHKKIRPIRENIKKCVRYFILSFEFHIGANIKTTIDQSPENTLLDVLISDGNKTSPKEGL